MTRIFLIGHVPLPSENLKKNYAPGARTWQLSDPLMSEGHEVTVVGIRIPFVYEDLPDVLECDLPGGKLFSVTPEVAESRHFLRDLVADFHPECLVGACAYPSYVACVARTELPFWADIYGSQLAEAQLKASVYGDDSFLEHFYHMVHTVVMRADRFSTVALRQKYELVGELAFARRLTSSTAGYDFVAHIPASCPDIPFSRQGAGRLRDRAGDDFLVLWSGGYNTWTDTATLFEGLSHAMNRNQRIRFVSTGGSIDGHDELTYPTLVRMVEGSKHRERFMLEGWIDRETARSYYLAANVGINIDAQTYEVMFGSRTRLLDWAVAGLPALSTNLCELTEELAAKKLLYTFQPGDPMTLAESLLELADNEHELRETGSRLRQHVLETYSNAATTQALLEWVSSPTHAPDWEDRKALVIPPEPPGPPITPESSATAKLVFYLRNEGITSTARRALNFAKKKAGTDAVP